MRKIFKIGIISSIAFLTLGLGFLIAAVALGATWGQFVDAVDTHDFSLIHDNISEKIAKDKIYYSDVDSLDIELGAGTLEIKETDEDQIIVEILSDPSGIVKTGMEGDTLQLSTRPRSAKNKVGLCLYIPEDTSFTKADLKLGAAAVTVGSLDADRLDVKLGAGSFNGTGEITADRSEWKVGVGELNLDYLDCGDLSMDCGMGSMSVTMADSQQDYRYEISCGAGMVAIGDDDYSMGSHSFKGNDADDKISIKCGMGSVDVAFDGD